jgi:periplasmic protein TonB
LKRFLVISIILHALVIALALFLTPEKEKEAKTMTAILVPPEVKPKPIEPARPVEKKPKIRSYDPVRTGETTDPKKLFAIPKGSKASKGKITGKESDRKKPSTSQTATTRSTASTTEEMSLKDKIFDKPSIDKTARAGKGSVKSVRGKGVSFDIGHDRHYGWVQRLSEKVSSVWRYPRELLERRIYSTVYVRITVRKDGTLKNAELVRTSGYKSLDDSALRALKEANPYWPLPDDWDEDELTIIGYFYVP